MLRSMARSLALSHPISLSNQAGHKNVTKQQAYEPGVQELMAAIIRMK
jgi:hypothetical protein